MQRGNAQYFQKVLLEESSRISPHLTAEKTRNFPAFFKIMLIIVRYTVAQLGEECITSRRSQFRFPMGSLRFFIDIILPAALWS
jgi:hypothetical protein